MRRTILLVTVIATAVLLAFSGLALAQQGERTTAAEVDPEPSFKSQGEERAAANKLIVQVRNDATQRDLEALNRRNGASIDKELAPELVPGLYRIHLPRGLTVRDAVSRYEASEDVIDFAEPDFIQDAEQDAELTANDTYYTNLWGLEKIQAPLAWNITYGQEYSNLTDYKPPLVAVIDTGVQIAHSDLKDNVWSNYDEAKGTSGVDDGPISTGTNSYGEVDDLNGWDYRRDDNSVYDNTNDAHGTHVAGTIGARGNNSRGVTGVNWQTEIAACKFMGASGGYTSDAISCLNYVVSELGAKVSNNSWGGGGYSSGLYNAIKAAGDKGHLFVAAAGNDGINTDSSPHYPSSYDLPNIISVASTTSSDARSSFSNYGLTSVDLGAPGSSIYSTVPDNTYKSYSGTSMATPHVTGTVALILAKNPSLTPTDLSTARTVKNLILDNVDQIDSLSRSGSTPVLTGGRLNTCKTVAKAAGVPESDLTTACPRGDSSPPPPPPPDPEPTTEGVKSFTLINADTDQDIGTFSNGAVVDFSDIGTNNLNVRANTEPATVGSVRFGYDSNSNYRTESTAPYALAGDSSGNYNAWIPTVGSHTITATAYSSSGASGTQIGSSLTIMFSAQ